MRRWQRFHSDDDEYPSLGKAYEDDLPDPSEQIPPPQPAPWTAFQANQTLVHLEEQDPKSPRHEEALGKARKAWTRLRDALQEYEEGSRTSYPSRLVQEALQASWTGEYHPCLTKS